MMPVFLRRPDITWDALRPLIMAGVAVQTEAWCQEHNKMCRLPEAREHYAGLPCPQWSSQHPQPVDLADAECALTAGAWIGLRRTLQEEKIVYENVMGRYHSGEGLYPMAFVVQHLGDLYWACSEGLPDGEQAYVGAKIEAQAFGGWNTRTRGYLNLRHRVKSMVELSSPLTRFQRRFHRVCACSWHDAYWVHSLGAEDYGLLAVDDELNEDLRWASKRPSTAWSQDADLVGVEAKWVGAKLTHPEVFKRALNDMETRLLAGYV